MKILKAMGAIAVESCLQKEGGWNWRDEEGKKMGGVFFLGESWRRRKKKKMGKGFSVADANKREREREKEKGNFYLFIIIFLLPNKLSKHKSQQKQRNKYNHTCIKW